MSVVDSVQAVIEDLLAEVADQHIQIAQSIFELLHLIVLYVVLVVVEQVIQVVEVYVPPLQRHENILYPFRVSLMQVVLVYYPMQDLRFLCLRARQQELLPIHRQVRLEFLLDFDRKQDHFVQVEFLVGQVQLNDEGIV